jgi:hypothetical protein
MYSQRCYMLFVRLEAARKEERDWTAGDSGTREDNSCTASSTVNNCLRGDTEDLSVTATAVAYYTSKSLPLPEGMPSAA